MIIRTTLGLVLSLLGTQPQTRARASPIEHLAQHGSVLQARDEANTSCEAAPAAWAEDLGKINKTVSDNYFEPGTFDLPDCVENKPNAVAARGQLTARGNCLGHQYNYRPLQTGNVGALIALGPAVKRTWDNARDRGSATRYQLDQYVQQARSRLDDVPGRRQEMQVKFENNYRPSTITDSQKRDYIYAARKIATFWDLTGYLGVNFDRGFVLKDFEAALPDAAGCYNRALVHTASYAEIGLQAWDVLSSGGDPNALSNRIPTSELLWQGWKSAAGDASRELKYTVLHTIFDPDTLNLMSAAHALWPENVDHLDSGSEVVQGTGSSLKGHGLWQPEDEAFNYLLGSPDVRTIVNMLMDHNPDMTYSTIGKLHTFPLNPLVERRDYEVPMIIVEYGRVANQQPTVETS